MLPALATLKAEMNMKPEVLVADQGYNNVLVLQKVELDKLTDAHVMVGEKTEEADNFTKLGFQFDAENNCYLCPQGHTLQQKGGIQERKDRSAIVYQAKTKVCLACSIRTKCTKSKTGRTITRYTDEEWVEKYRERMQSETAKSLLKQRKSIIEHIFGVIKCWMGKIPLLLRGKNKVQSEINLYTTAYNLKRLIKILGFDKVFQMIMRFNQLYIEKSLVLVCLFTVSCVEWELLSD
jgi:hypothetical protein